MDLVKWLSGIYSRIYRKASRNRRRIPALLLVMLPEIVMPEIALVLPALVYGPIVACARLR